MDNVTEERIEKFKVLCSENSVCEELLYEWIEENIESIIEIMQKNTKKELRPFNHVERKGGIKEGLELAGSIAINYATDAFFEHNDSAAFVIRELACKLKQERDKMNDNEKDVICQPEKGDNL